MIGLGGERGGGEGGDDDVWIRRLREREMGREAASGSETPPPKGPRPPTISRRDFINWGFALGTAIPAAFGGFFVGVAALKRTYDQIAKSASEVHPRIIISSDTTQEVSWTQEEIVRAVKRVSDLESLLQSVLLYPNVGINTTGVTALSEEEYNKLLLTSNPSGRVAKWEFSDGTSNSPYNLNVENTYEGDGRLSQGFLRLSTENSRIPPIGDFLNQGSVKVDQLDEARNRLLKLPNFLSFGLSSITYTNGDITPARRGIGIDPKTGAVIEIDNNTRGLYRLRITEPFYTKPQETA